MQRSSARLLFGAIGFRVICPEISDYCCCLKCPVYTKREGLIINSTIEHSDGLKMAARDVYHMSPNKKKAASRALYHACPDRKKAASRALYQACPDRKKAASRALYRAAPDKKKATIRELYKACPDKMKVTARALYRASPDKKKAAARALYRLCPDKKKAGSRAVYRLCPDKKKAAARAIYSVCREMRKAAFHVYHAKTHSTRLEYFRKYHCCCERRINVANRARYIYIYISHFIPSCFVHCSSDDTFVILDLKKNNFETTAATRYSNTPNRYSAGHLCGGYRWQFARDRVDPVVPFGISISVAPVGYSRLRATFG